MFRREQHKNVNAFFRGATSLARIMRLGSPSESQYSHERAKRGYVKLIILDLGVPMSRRLRFLSSHGRGVLTS